MAEVKVTTQAVSDDEVSALFDTVFRDEGWPVEAVRIAATVRGFRDLIDKLVNRKPEHDFAGDAEGHNCVLCHPDSIWKCDRATHPTTDWERAEYKASLQALATMGATRVERRMAQDVLTEVAQKKMEMGRA